MPRRAAPKQGAEADDAQDAPGAGGHGGECDLRTDTGCAYGYPDGGW
ncbi:hypothetical protein [Streptomyces vinaceus]